jgi:hypothetical protein
VVVLGVVAISPLVLLCAWMSGRIDRGIPQSAWYLLETTLAGGRGLLVPLLAAAVLVITWSMAREENELDVRVPAAQAAQADEADARWRIRRRCEQIGIRHRLHRRLQTGQTVERVPRPALPGHGLRVPRTGGQPLQKLVLFGGRETAVLPHHPSGSGRHHRVGTRDRQFVVRRIHGWRGEVSPWR